MGFVLNKQILEAKNLTGNICIIGYGSQGRAHALNLRDSMYQSIYIGLKENSQKHKQVAIDGLKSLSLSNAVNRANHIVMAIPDEEQKEFYDVYVKDYAQKDCNIIFLHGYAMTYENLQLRDDLNYLMCAPKAAGEMLRNLFVDGKGCFAVIANLRDDKKSWQNITAYAKALGCHKAGIISSTFKEECICDLFSEQAVLCGGISRLINDAFNLLVNRGYQPEIAYIECLHEVKLISDLYYKYGIANSNEKISNMAEFGKLDASKKFSAIDNVMEEILDDIENKKFVKRFRSEQENLFKELLAQREKEKTDKIENIGKKLRKKIFKA